MIVGKYGVALCFGNGSPDPHPTPLPKGEGTGQESGNEANMWRKAARRAGSIARECIGCSPPLQYTALRLLVPSPFGRGLG